MSGLSKEILLTIIAVYPIVVNLVLFEPLKEQDIFPKGGVDSASLKAFKAYNTLILICFSILIVAIKYLIENNSVPAMIICLMILFLIAAGTRNLAWRSKRLQRTKWRVSISIIVIVVIITYDILTYRGVIG